MVLSGKKSSIRQFYGIYGDQGGVEHRDRVSWRMVMVWEALHFLGQQPQPLPPPP